MERKLLGQLVNHSYLKLEGRINPEDAQRGEGVGKIQGKSIHQAGAFLESEHGEGLLCDHQEKVGSVGLEGREWDKSEKEKRKSLRPGYSVRVDILEP